MTVQAKQVYLPFHLIQNGRQARVGGRTQSFDSRQQRCVVLGPPRRFRQDKGVENLLTLQIRRGGNSRRLCTLRGNPAPEFERFAPAGIREPRAVGNGHQPAALSNCPSGSLTPQS